MSESGSSGLLALDAESLYADLRAGVARLLDKDTQLAGITSGGVWLGERLIRDLQLPQPLSTLSSALHRDDFAQRGLTASAQTSLAFDVNSADILVLDDVLYTGRTIRAVINELFDYGRPARVRLAVLVDRGGRQLPIQADFAAARLSLRASQKLALARRDDGSLHFAIEEA
ncbi:bifunctional pyr operon transcriptional regulator/uracil phosphoribosyltransferase PyrR [Corticibacter populi]|uniref:Bifunctional pyr operon transcriptional regulator/uracil phosphoribosyltransferase PyrR n=1 Tax=Corticibacter populi TaxID=1550736 RepID=A0A3M6QPB3_9BURK|nr:bifunctional pyr operon transcriptional regulator/uracil phosphoribosyltransferase PyrR [Corticibacter populi]RMX04900.1 bifunctional pyr operon transcriptional regulator/uracil phosphoribosyltransferase PyrR [Corticibacter populi]RZS33677.1 pyrimidine operon attenuation protein/uracil phosphoribosyltransferase [Corticibacter populi]